MDSSSRQITDNDFSDTTETKCARIREWIWGIVTQKSSDTVLFSTEWTTNGTKRTHGEYTLCVCVSAFSNCGESCTHEEQTLNWYIYIYILVKPFHLTIGSSSCHVISFWQLSSFHSSCLNMSNKIVPFYSNKFVSSIKIKINAIPKLVDLKVQHENNVRSMVSIARCYVFYLLEQ